jgi:phospholipid-binding lipoprotein MlaA
MTCLSVAVPASALAGAPMDSGPADSDSDSAPPAPASDPAEGANRAVFAVNHAIDHAALAPVARVYRGGVPHAVRECFGHFISNLEEPTIFMNDVLQANPRRAATSVGRFAVNSTIGIGGLFDFAGRWGMRFHDGDLGQTFGRWGVPAGPSVQIPILGPSNVRDTVGAVLGFGLDPATYVSGGAIPAIYTAAGVVGVVNRRAELLPVTDHLEKTSPDYYAALRDRAAKHRDDLVRQSAAHDDPNAGEEKPHAQMSSLAAP